MLTYLSVSLYKARKTFLSFTPSLSLAIIGKLRKPIYVLVRIIHTIKIGSKAIHEKSTVTEAVGVVVGHQMIRQIKRVLIPRYI